MISQYETCHRVVVNESYFIIATGNPTQVCVRGYRIWQTANFNIETGKLAIRIIVVYSIEFIDTLKSLVW